MSLISRNPFQTQKMENLDQEELADGSPPPELLVEDDKKKKKKNKKRSRENDEGLKNEEEKEMKRLESALFGNLYTPLQFGKEDRERDEDDAPLFFVDKSTDGTMAAAYEGDSKPRVLEKEERKPAWVDEQDEDEGMLIDLAKKKMLRKLITEPGANLISAKEYGSRLRAQHAKLNPNTDWANSAAAAVDSSDDESDVENDDNVLRSNEQLVVRSNAKLLPGTLEFSRLVDANREEPSNGPINSVQFHRNGQLLLTAGLDRRLRFFQVDGKRNTKVQSIFIEDCPIYKASFMPDGSQVIVSGRRKFFYSFDMVSANFDKIGPLTGREEKSLEAFEVSPDSKTIAFIGNEGYILLVSPKTKELIGTMKMNGTARSLAFVDNGQQLMSSGGDGQVYHWDLRMRRCIHKGVDEGCISGSALCASPDSSLFAAGSSSGIVNIYKREEFLGGKRKPLKTIENLTTKVDFIKFNHDAQILAICSSMKKDSLKLVHIPSFTVFSNWPVRCSLSHPRCLDFSPGGGFMAFGNAGGKVCLYKLHHYSKA